MPNANNSLVGQYLAGHPDLGGQFTFGLSLNGLPSAAGSSGSSSSQSGQDSSGGQLDIFKPNPASFTGQVATVNVASTQTQTNFGSLPPQLGSYDWTVQMDGWQFSTGQQGQDVSGGKGTYVTVEMSYPYILLGQADAQKVCEYTHDPHTKVRQAELRPSYSDAAIPGSKPYTFAANAVNSAGVPVYQDPNAQSWSMPCSLPSGVSLVMTFQGVNIPVQPSDLYTTLNDGTCVGNVKGWTDPNRGTYILGSSFLRGAYMYDFA